MLPVMYATGIDTHNDAGRDHLLSVAEVAAVLRVDPMTIRRRIWAGELAAVKLGTARNAPMRIAASDLAEWLEAVNT
jgi:excisionase family DNA binding protein